MGLVTGQTAGQIAEVLLHIKVETTGYLYTVKLKQLTKS